MVVKVFFFVCAWSYRDAVPCGRTGCRSWGDPLVERLLGSSPVLGQEEEGEKGVCWDTENTRKKNKETFFFFLLRIAFCTKLA